MAAKVHGDDAIAGGNEVRREEAVLLLQVAEARHQDDQRAVAVVGVGDAAVRPVEETDRFGEWRWERATHGG